MQFCSVNSCQQAASKKSYCNKHYLRFWKYGDPLKVTTEKGALHKWIEDHARYDGDDCIKWPFGSRPNGYGSIRIGGKHTTASAVMCRVAHGEPESQNMEAAHSCGNGHLGCMNPNHLRWATSLENAADMVAHDRSCRGTKRVTTKLTENSVQIIRQRLKLGHKPTHLAAEYNVSKGAIDGIRKGTSWKWLKVSVVDLIAND